MKDKSLAKTSLKSSGIGNAIKRKKLQDIQIVGKVLFMLRPNTNENIS